jgi:hypothetical protein
MNWAVVLGVLTLFMLPGGCMSVDNKITGTSRAGAEQMLLTGTSDRAISLVDFRPLSGARVYLDTSNVKAADEGWVIFSLRRALAANGALLVAASAEAQVIVEAAVGAYGTDEKDHRFSLPSLSFLGTLPIPTGGASASALVRRNRQDAIVKLALFGYDAQTRALVWESGTIQVTQKLDRDFVGGTNFRRKTSMPELENYPRREGFKKHGD